MSVRTTADEHIDDAKDAIDKAIDNLTEVVIKGCWGSDDYAAEYEELMRKSLNKLVKLRKKLRK